MPAVPHTYGTGAAFRTFRRTQPPKVVESAGNALGDGLVEGILKLIVSLLD